MIREHFRGRRGHDYDSIKALLARRNCRLPLDVAEALRRIASWATDLRYEVGLLPAREAEAFLKSCEAVLQWVDRSI